MRRAASSAFTVPDPGVETFQYNNANELTRQVVDGFIQSFVHDDWGRMVTKTRGGYQAVYKYRFGDKLKQINTNFPGESAAQVEYSYDGMGRRRVMILGGTAVQWQRYDLGWNVLGEYAHVSGWDIGARTNSYTWMGMTPLSETPGTNPGTGASQYYLHDHLTSTRDLFNASKVKTARLDYEPHGQQANQFGLTPGRTFTGKAFDEESGLYHFPYRHYSPNQARWMQRDPLDMVDGPNVYAYVKQNPVSSVDPLGLTCEEDCQTAYEHCRNKVILFIALSAIVCNLLPHWLARAACLAASAIIAYVAYGACIDERSECLKKCHGEPSCRPQCPPGYRVSTMMGECQCIKQGRPALPCRYS